MDWFRDHFVQILIAVAAAIAAYLNNRRREKEGEPADFDDDGIPDNRPGQGPRRDGGQYDPTSMEMEEADRTRRLQEEIRRKIAERRGERPPPPVVAPRPVATGDEPIPEIFRRVLERVEPPAPPPLPDPAELAAAREREAAAERQRQLQGKMRELEAQRAEARRRAAQAAANAPAAARTMTVSAELSGAALLADLRQPGAARRAFVLREVLGTPAGLR